MKKDIKIYNLLFPLWFFPLLIPWIALTVLAGNFVIDSIVLLILMLILKVSNKGQFYISNIFKIYGFGLVSDIIGVLFMILMTAIFHIGSIGDELYLTVPALTTSAFCIFISNYFIIFKKYDKKMRLTMAITFAVITAPYTFIVPSSLLYG